jgi:energy-coupling factor transporter ATP-binding protein EcfA2
VCLDECFAHQDDERAAAFMRTLETLTASTGMQCFLFTSQERERRLADRVFGKYRRITLRK